MRDVQIPGWWMLAVATLAALGGCSSTHVVSTDGSSETHFLRRCTEDCAGGLSCVCGVCTLPCTRDAVCTSLAAGASCATLEDAACGDGDAPQACELTCERDADCAVLSADHRCAAGVCRAGAAGGARDGRLPAEGPACLASGVIADIAVTSTDRVDLLFVIDNSPSMAAEQAVLRDQFPKLIARLTTGVRRDGTMFLRAKDLHLGVVSSDLGAARVQGLDGCAGLGDDGILRNAPSPEVDGCRASYPRFLSYVADRDDPVQAAGDLACIATLGAEGCSFEQPLEAALKALWPALDVDPATGRTHEPNRIQFVSDSDGSGELGHGDRENAGFLRNDVRTGQSVIAVVVVTDEDDCSSADTSHFTPPDRLDPQDPLAEQPLNQRCHHNARNLHRVERYIDGLKALRPGNEHLVLFAAIAGVPVDLAETALTVDWGDDEARAAFYDRVLADARMMEIVDPDSPDSEVGLVPSCMSGRGRAYPPRRIVEVARGFGESGSVHSICQEDLGPAIDRIAETIAGRLGAACLPRPLVRDAAGLVGDCEVVWELPAPGTAGPSTPTQCGQPGFEFLLDQGDRVHDRGGAICRIPQLAVRLGARAEVGPTEVDGVVFNEGWYYDDFSEEVASECIGSPKQRIAFTPEAKPPAGVVVKLHCLSAIYLDSLEQPTVCSAGPESATSERVGDACLPDAVPEGGFDERVVYLGTADADCGGGVCMVDHLRGDPRANCVMTAPDPATGEPGTVCASKAEIEDRIYCTCRCDAPDGYAQCACPDGFSCVDVIDQGGDDIRGGYCARDGTSSR